MIANAHMDDAPTAHSSSRVSSRTRLLALVPFLGALACSGPSARQMDELVREGDVFLDPATLQPYSGPVFSILDDAQLVSSREAYQDGRKHGPYEWYSDSGRLFEKGSYLMGTLDGPYEAYWESGGIHETGTYHAGEFNGPRTWYRNGELIELVTYVDGVIHGPYERYGLDGTLDLHGDFRAGVPCGTWLEGNATITYASCVRSAD